MIQAMRQSADVCELCSQYLVIYSSVEGENMRKRISVIGVVHLAVLLGVLAACDKQALRTAEFAEHQETPVVIKLSTEPAQLKVCAIVYWDGRFKGASRPISDGEREPWIGDQWSDDVSSAKVSPGCVLNVWIDGHYGGAHKTLQGSVPWVGDDWNDEISSWTCDCG
jgi:hypothetical protein